MNNGQKAFRYSPSTDSVTPVLNFCLIYTYESTQLQNSTKLSTLGCPHTYLLFTYISLKCLQLVSGKVVHRVVEFPLSAHSVVQHGHCTGNYTKYGRTNSRNVSLRD